MATSNLPAWGYGIRYQYGMFRQSIKAGFQHEQPDYWLLFGNPWEIERLNVTYPIKYYGHVSVHEDASGRQMFRCALMCLVRVELSCFSSVELLSRSGTMATCRCTRTPLAARCCVVLACALSVLNCFFSVERLFQC